MFRNYFKIAIAVFMRRKFFTFINLFGIVFTLTILMIATAFMDHIFGETPPEVNQHRTLGIYRVYAETESESGSISTTNGMASYHLLEKYLKDLPGVEKTSISRSEWKMLSYVDGERIESFLKYADANFWDILQFDFIEGRPFSEDEYNNAAHVAVINASTREKYFKGDTATGKKINVAGKTYKVVGVVEDVPFIRYVPFSDIWVPQSLETDYDDFGEFVGLYTGLIMAKDRKYLPQIREEFNSRMENINLEGSHYSKIVAIPETMFESVARIALSQGMSLANASSTLMAIFVILAILFMVLPTLNMVNLNISRILERASEIGVRKAFGAASSTLIGQFVFENVILTLIGGVIGLGFAYLALAVISDAGWIPYAKFSLNYRIFSGAMLIALFFGMFSGIYPAWRMSRLHPVDAIRGGV